MRIAILITTLALLAVLLGGCGGSGGLYSVNMLNGTDQTLQMDVRQGKGGGADPVLISKKVARAERLTWSGRSRDNTYFQAVRLESDMPAGSPVELRLVPGSTTTAGVKLVNGQLQITNPVVQRSQEQRPEDVVPPPNRLPSGQNRR